MNRLNGYVLNLNKAHSSRNMSRTVFLGNSGTPIEEEINLEASLPILVHRQYFRVRGIGSFPRLQCGKVPEELSDTCLSSKEIKAASVLETSLPFRTLSVPQGEQYSFPRSSNRYMAGLVCKEGLGKNHPMGTSRKVKGPTEISVEFWSLTQVNTPFSASLDWGMEGRGQISDSSHFQYLLTKFSRYPGSRAKLTLSSFSEIVKSMSHQ